MWYLTLYFILCDKLIYNIFLLFSYIFLLFFFSLPKIFTIYIFKWIMHVFSKNSFSAPNKIHSQQFLLHFSRKFWKKNEIIRNENVYIKQKFLFLFFPQLHVLLKIILIINFYFVECKKLFTIFIYFLFYFLFFS